MVKELIVFDLDGTLVDTLPDIAAAMNRVLRNHGYSVHRTQRYAAFVGRGLSRTLCSAVQCSLEESSGGGAKGSVSDARFRSMFSELLEYYTRSPARDSAVYPGMGALVDDLRSQGASLGVFTNKSQPIAAAVIDALFDRGSFDFVIGSQEGSQEGGREAVPLKPDPSALLNHPKLQKIEKSSILMIGDSEVDAEAARRAGIDFAGASWGYRGEAALHGAGARAVFQSPEHLHRHVNQQLNQWR